MPDTNDFGDTAIAADEPESFGDTPLHGFGDTPVFGLKRPTPETFGQVGAGIPEIPLGNAEGSIPGLNADVASGEGPGAFETLMSPVVELPPIPPEAMLGPAAMLFPKGAVREAATGAGRFVSKTASSLTSPGMMLLGGLGAVAPPAAAAIIAGMGAHSIGPAAVEAIEASKRGDVAGFTESALDAAMAGTMASGGARATFSALKPSPPIKELHSILDNARANGAPEAAKAFEETISGNGVIKPRLSNKPPVLPDQVEPVDLVPEPAPPISIKANAQMLDVLEPAPGAVGTVEADQALAAESDNSIILRTQDPAARANAFAARDAALGRVRQREPAPAPDETPTETPPEPTPPTEPVAPPSAAPVIAVPPTPQKPEESGVGRIPVENVPLADEQQPGFTGMGGAVPSEFGNTGGSPTAAKFKLIDKQRMDRGLEPLIKPESNTDAMALQKAMAELDMRGPIAQDELIAKLEADPTLAIKDWENHLLVLRLIDMRNEMHRAMREQQQAYDDGRMDDMAAISPRVQVWSEAVSKVEEVLRKAGTAASGALRSRKLMLNEDFSVEQMKMTRLADRKFKRLSPEAEAAENAELAAKSEALLASNRAFEARVAELEKQASDAEAAKVIDEAKRAAEAQPSYAKPVLEAAERIVQGWEKRADAARARLKEKLWLTGTNPDPTIIIDLAEIGVAHIGRNIVDFAKWSDAMVSEFGEKMKPLLKDVWDASQKLSNVETDKLKEPLRESVKRKIKPVDVAAKVTDAKEKIGLKLQQGDTEAVAPNVNALVRALVEQDPNISRDALVDTVHGILRDFLPDITRQEAADAISGRGKFWTPPQDAVSKTVRDLKTQIRLVEHQADVLAKKPLPRTGYQPEPLSDAARQEQAKLNELKRKYGVVVTDPASQLASTLAARKTYYRHRISDLEQEISTREKIVKTKSPSPTDPELDALRAEHKQLKADHDEIFGRPEKTPEQRAAAALKAVDRSIVELERQIQTGDIGPKSRASKTPNTPELEAARARRGALLAERDELRDLDQALNEAKAEKAKATQIAAIEKEIATVKEQITKGDLAAKQTSPRQNRPAQPEIEQAKQRLEELRDKLTEARAGARKADPVRLAESERKSIEAQKKTLEKQIAEREGMITSGNLSPGQRMNRPLSPVEEARKQRIEAELAPLKQKLDQTNAILEQARKDARPVKSPEELALAALKTRLTKSNADLKDKLARGDFSPRPKRPPIDISKDNLAMEAKAENERLKKEYQQGRIRDQMKHWGKGKMLWEGTKEAVNLHRNFWTSFDLSAVLRQGGFFTFSHPVKAARALKTSIEALVSEKAALTEEQRIWHRQNAPLYARDKLYLPEIMEARPSAMEEMTMSRLARNIPGLKASNRAFITFLNRMRADMYDSLVENLPLKDRGRPTVVEGKAVADFVNVATGRGKLGRFEAAGEIASTILFSPRLMVSRFQLLAGQPFYGGTARTRLAFAKEYARALIGVATVYTLGELAGATVEEDPRSSDFGKLKWGNSRLDPLAGLQQVTVLLSRVVTGKSKSLRTGKLTNLRDPKFGQPDTAETIGRFLRTKLAPAPGLFVDVVTGSNVVKEPVNAKRIAKDIVIPLGYQDIFNVMREQGIPAGTALELLNILGMSLQHFDASKKQPKN